MRLMLRRIVELTATLFEAGGTFAMSAGAVVAVGLAWRDRSGGGAMVFRTFRNRLGRAIILGLELLVAADILRTISTEPTLQQVVVLGIIVSIRTFLSFSLEVELEGRWPWQVPREDSPPLPEQPPPTNGRDGRRETEPR
jgi:uncharacterized membrane protein